MKHCLILIAAFLGVGMFCCSCGKGSRSDPSVERVLAAHKTGEWDLDVSKLTLIQEEPSDFVERMSGKIDIHAVPPPPIIEDAFVYDIIVAKEGKRFWIRRTGGDPAVDEIYGVGVLQDDGTIEYVEPSDAPDKE